MGELNEANLREQLLAFADGELDAASTVRVLDYLMEHPESLRALRDEKRLSLIAHELLARSAPQTPAALSESISALAGKSARDTAAESADPWKLPAWLLVAAMIFLAIGLTVGRAIGPHAGDTNQRGAITVPASVIAQATRVHADCSRLAEGLHTAGYPKNVGPLARDVQVELHSDHPWPDLTSIGFFYRGAGPCAEPLDQTVHLLYHTMKPGSNAAISVFVQEDKGQFSLEGDRVYNLAGADSPFPVLAWEGEHVIYFLIADNDADAQAALRVIRGK